MRRKLFYIISEAILIFLSAILGAFAWIHGTEVFNSPTPLETLRMDLDAHWLAYLVIAIICIALVVVLYYRAKSDSELATRDDMTKILHFLILTARKLGVSEPEIESEIQSKPKVVKRRGKKRIMAKGHS